MRPEQRTLEQLRFIQILSALVFLFTAASQTLQGQTYTVLDSFDRTDGSEAGYDLVQGVDGNLYGVTAAGGETNNGTVFSVSPSGVLTTIYNFCVRGLCPDGSYPTCVLVQSDDGKLYGTTRDGGANHAGTVFSITTAGVLTTVYSFCSLPACRDGSHPFAGVIRAHSGSLFGTTFKGGTHGGGTVFELKPGQGLTTVYSFCETGECADGLQPESTLLEAPNGNLYGNTSSGGNVAACAPTGCGTIFEMTPSGLLTTLHTFSGQDGSSPTGALIQARDGNLYGATYGGGTGAYEPGGTFFRISQDGVLTTLYNFCNFDYCEDGSNPESGPVEGTDGNFYGTTYQGGALGVGSIYKITPGGALTTPYSFSCSPPEGCIDGAYPRAGLTQDTSGVFYGLCNFGGVNGNGAIFSLSDDLAPFLEPRPNSGRVGASVDIIGAGLTGTTEVSFSGIAATFQVLSDSLIEATVPISATSGPVISRKPGARERSKAPFQVLP